MSLFKYLEEELHTISTSHMCFVDFDIMPLLVCFTNKLFKA